MFKLWARWLGLTWQNQLLKGLTEAADNAGLYLSKGLSRCHHHGRHDKQHADSHPHREVELNLVTDGLDSILHQPECSSWQAEYTEIGTENGESSLWSIITRVIIMVITRVIIMVIINLTSRSSSWSSLWYLWSSSWLLLGTAWLTQNGHLVLEDGQHQVQNIVTL